MQTAKEGTCETRHLIFLYKNNLLFRYRVRLQSGAIYDLLLLN